MRGRRDALTQAAVAAVGRAVARHVAALPEFRAADALVAYAAIGSEVPTGELIELAQGAGLPTFLPRLDGERLCFAAHRRGDELARGRFGIAEPRGAAVADLGSRPLVLLPLLAFDRRGTRLGRGGGHYDRAGASWPAAAIRVGLAYAFQEVDELPRDPWDVPLDLVVTEQGALRCRPIAAAPPVPAAAEAGR